MKKILTVVRDTLSLLWMFAAAIAVVTIMVILFTPPASAQESQSKLLDPSNDPWDSVLRIRVVEVDEWGCQLQAGWSQQYFKNIERRVCPPMEKFFGSLSEAQMEKALKEGMKILHRQLPTYAKTRPQDKVLRAAYRRFYKKIVGAAG